MTPEPLTEELLAMYEQEALEYYQSLPVEDTIDTMPQAEARKRVVLSFSALKAMRPDIHCFNELLIEYPTPAGEAPGRVVPNNLVVVHPEPIVATNSYDTSRQLAPPFLAVEYVNPYRRKEFEQNAGKYERDLRIPYYLRVYSHEQRFSLFQLREGKYQPVPPNSAGRLAIPELELEAGLLGEWMRFWYRGELVPLPSELFLEIRALKAERDEMERVREAEAAAEAEASRLCEIETEVAKLREELARLKGKP